ncbi:Protein of unknown function [Modicisalibacter muralis]|uniref:DUF3450 domain-containing protein n=1 Tax=Modicisalibacter muralis TaxID=119000 RepID=A0A1G9MBZ8_9GAMM|nr:DUF3450 domain-containing protein [Halomonas muralis]SDL71205.1 Protein of unknown function [Halomonas muralis]
MRGASEESMIAENKLRKRLRRPWHLSAVLLLGISATVPAQDALREQSIAAQQAQAELQDKIDTADDATREALRELRATEREAHRLRAYNAELAPLIERRAATIEQRERALDQLSVTRETLPVSMRDMVESLRRWIESDMPFLREERLARVESLKTMLVNPAMTPADKLDRLLGAWRAELDYGREIDAWRGSLVGNADRQVEYLRLGRVGFYYLTPDGDEGGVWKASAGEWQALNDDQLGELRKGLSIAREQRAPELLALPVSVEVTQGQARNDQKRNKEARS